MNILYIVTDSPEEWNSSEWRCAIPCRVIRERQGHDATLMGLDDFVKSVEEYSPQMMVVARSDLIFIQRSVFWPKALWAARYWRGIGKAVLVDLDDHYLGLPPGNPAYPYWNNPMKELGGKTPLEAQKEAVLFLDGVTSPNKLILRSWKDVGVENTYWIPNFALGARWQDLKKESHEGFWVGWGGSFSHYDTWVRSGCAEGLRMAFEARPALQFVLWGADMRILEWLPLERKRHGGMIHPKEIERWPKELAQFDLALAPLGGDYDQHRSWIHALEPMLAKVPWIGSQGEPFSDLADWGCLVDDSPEQWAEKIIDAHDNYSQWQARAEAGYKQAVALTIEANASEYLDLMNKIVLKRRAECGYRIPGAIYVH